MSTSHGTHPAGRPAPLVPDPVRVSGLVKKFGAFTAVDGLDLTVTAGEVHGFLGPNGAGKTTTLRVLLGLHRRTAGTVSVLGLDPQADPAAVARRISYVPGDVALWPNLTGQEVLDALAGIRGAHDPAAERRLVADFVLDTGRKVRTYSKGNRQKVMLVAAFAARTDLLVLDEPTSGLDPLMEECFQRCVREAAGQGRTVLLSSHILHEVERLCENVTIVRDGRVVETGRVADLRHLSSATVTARVPAAASAGVRNALRALGTGPDDGTVGPTGQVDLRVPGAVTTAVLRVLIDADATSVTCTPATLDDLFLRHYEGAAR